MEILNTFTLAIASSTASAVLVLILIHTWRIRHATPGLGEWIISMSCWTLGSLLSLAFNTSLSALVAKVVGNGLIMLHAAIMYDGLMRYYNTQKSVTWRIPNYLLVALSVLGLAYFTIVTPDISRRVIILNATLILLFARCALEPLLRGHGREHSAQWILSVAWVTVSGLLAMRLHEHALRPLPDQEFHASMARGVSLQLVILVTLIVEMLQAYCFITLIGDKFEAELQRSREHEQRLSSAQRRFFNMVSHDFKTPLAIIARSAEMLSLTAPPQDAVTLARCKTVEDNARGLMRLLDASLSNAALEQGTLRLVNESFCLKTLLEELHTSFSVVWPHHDIHLKISDIPSFIYGDKRMLYHLFANLLDNACKYSPARSTVRLGMQCQDGNWEVRIMDQGIGIPQDDISRLGERGFRAGNVTHVEGTGTGVHTAHLIVALHGGKLHYKSSGAGTEAWVVLPIQPDDSTKEDGA